MSSKRRLFTPYYHPTVLNLAEQARLRELKIQLDFYNEISCPVTYSDLTGQWETWQRPIRVFLSGGMTDVAASGFHRVPYEPPKCPHIHESDHNRVMKLHLKKRFGVYKEADFFRATAHSCSFTVIIHRLHEPLVTQDPEMIAEQMAHQREEEVAETLEEYSYDLDHLSGPIHSSPSEAEVERLLALQQLPTPPSTASSCPTAIKFHSHLDNIYVNPRVSKAFYTPTKPLTSLRPRPIRAGARPTSSRFPSFFEETVAVARANSEASLIDHINLNVTLGVFKVFLSQHPAADLTKTHRVLEPYDERIFPGCLARMFEHMQYLNTNVGRVIRELNSTLGVPLSAVRTLNEYAVTCQACLCIFSIDGFNAHLSGKRCMNCTSSIEVNPKIIDLNDVDKVHLCTFAERPTDVIEFIDKPTGAALVEWNSRIGVPRDVWAVIHTAYVECTDCHLCRSFHGDIAHRDPNGKCKDLGEVTASLITGKGKEHADGVETRSNVAGNA
ncbi:hypothetical protein C0992_007246 [Termitomyces sp. T32_za158]|nr:hypothetical protein C0992_007246 [Termitomyces sp. T32_za158]